MPTEEKKSEIFQVTLGWPFGGIKTGKKFLEKNANLQL